jgi:hypothetical protein
MITIIRIISFFVSAFIVTAVLILLLDNSPFIIGLISGIVGQISSDLAADWYIDKYIL